MTSITINPSIEKKRAKCVGRAAAGEHVGVTIAGLGHLADSGTMYLRVMFGGRTIAQFPKPVDEGMVQEAWTAAGAEDADLTCTLNLNTVQAMKSCYAPDNECIVVLEELGDEDEGVPPTLYFVAPIVLQGWPQRRCEEPPYDLGRYPGLIERWTEQIGNIAASVTQGSGYADISITDKNGVTTTARVADGAQGPQGEPGSDADLSRVADAVSSINDAKATVNDLKAKFNALLAALKGLS